ncbi:MAG: hypothetical protein WA733_15180 [Methylocystis sp.]
MRAYVFAFAAMVLASFSTASFAQPIESGPRNSPVVRDDGGGDCEELRKACLHKEELGEKGEGNCARYRELCKD